MDGHADRSDTFHDGRAVSTHVYRSASADLHQQMLRPLETLSFRQQRVDLWGRLSNPPEAIKTVAAQGFAASHGVTESAESRSGTVPESAHRRPPEEKGRLSNPIQRRLCPTEIGELIAAYRAGATINELADRYGLHRSTVAVTLDRHHIERHHSHTEWTSETLADAADLYAAGLSLAAVAARYGIDPQTVANRFHRARIPVRTRRGWPAQNKRN